ncbi:MurR/RpiR family transcriptional regulator [Weissella diestrammenae]|uniref:MurR/RpiR family transcriptional regulator n=1 Tax=Weissella diestrammenae TaxID=1162633 RepID=A0A7G9T7F8_9LACO|nr:MurR/RpiR family transcriptional regulator [Weissella diestrammenae]MCM0582088.1 MurR/RpiR family transcriptional regulator [Weissella diestrammenae]QNN76033.1 MurR/RpiR family transcriptional regulator [Weissella diestrammenae]
MAQSGFSRIRSFRSQLNGSDAKIADYILTHEAATKTMTIQEMADATGLSTATISRFVKRVGYNSFREFSLSLAIIVPNNNTFFGEISEGDDRKAIVQKVFSGAENALASTLDISDKENFATAAAWIVAARKVGFFGIGGSSIVAFNAYHKFLRTPIDSFQHPDYDIQVMQAVRMNADDVAVVISHSGRNHDTLAVMQHLQAHGVKIIAITAFPNSELAKNSDLVLASAAEEVNIRSESMSSLIAQLTIVDTLFTLVGVQMGDQTAAVVDEIRQAIEQTRR